MCNARNIVVKICTIKAKSKEIGFAAIELYVFVTYCSINIISNGVMSH